MSKEKKRKPKGQEFKIPLSQNNPNLASPDTVKATALAMGPVRPIMRPQRGKTRLVWSLSTCLNLLNSNRPSKWPFLSSKTTVL